MPNIAPFPFMDDTDYDHLFGIATDGHIPYEEWVQKLHKQESEAASEGWTPYRTYINPSFFEEWCKKNQQPLSTESVFLYSQILFKGMASLLWPGDLREEG
ncbi:hypothetical protein [Roseimicrobium sp. ORNL1]|uniref:hypothetical protein n=1 Tax=Roseimicrobium sp. ORNL1 TaxID=2711231 RepID=UPI0013E12AFD|nr:hypothetical protein [Roseimicrobium sp. ORNL1]QIF00077.1 hypothetical protein G5S37_00590 [Roseimicrobium sp. ORNL1]